MTLERRTVPGRSSPLHSSFTTSSSRTIRRTHRLLPALLILLSLHTSFTHALQCVYPTYNVQVQPGQSVALTWQSTVSDLAMFNSLTATLYCMDVDGNLGGIWRTITTLFQNRAIGISTQQQYQFTVPNCGPLARDVAIRIVSTGLGSSQNDACYFTMKPQTIAVPSVPPIIITTTTTTTTAANAITTVAPPLASSGTTPPTSSTTSSISGTLNPSSTISGTPTLSSGTSVSGLPYASGLPYPPLPPLPPLPDDPSGSGSESGSGSGPSDNSPGNPGGSGKTVAVSIGSMCVGLALIAIVALLALRRWRTRRRMGQSLLAHGGGKGGKRGGMKEKLIAQGRRLKGSSKNGGRVEGDFFLMKVEDDDDEYDGKHDSRDYYDHEVVAAMAKYRKSQPLATLPEVEIESSIGTGIDEEKRPGHERESTISYPPNAYVESILPHSESHQHMYSSDDDFTTSSMRSSCETSSVVRNYWAASMAARAERRLEGYPPSTNYFDNEGFIVGDRRSTPSQSSQSRKADIMSMDDISFAEGTQDSSRGPSRGGPAKKHYRSTINSLQRNLRRSMSMSLTSLQSGASTTDDESMHQYQRGFRASINTEYLDHLNIKALQDGQRQLAAYSHYYRQNPTLTMSTVDRTMTTTTSQRTSAVPSLTSTNDPFQTFDSNEGLVNLDPFSDPFSDPMSDPMSDPFSNPLSNPFSDQQYVVENDGAQESNTSLSTVQGMRTVANGGNDDVRSNSTLLRSFPPPPVVSSSSSSLISFSSTSSSISSSTTPTANTNAKPYPQ